MSEEFPDISPKFEAGDFRLPPRPPSTGRIPSPTHVPSKTGLFPNQAGNFRNLPTMSEVALRSASSALLRPQSAQHARLFQTPTNSQQIQQSQNYRIRIALITWNETNPNPVASMRQGLQRDVEPSGFIESKDGQPRLLGSSASVHPLRRVCQGGTCVAHER